MPDTLLRSALTAGIPAKGIEKIPLSVAVNVVLNSMLTSMLLGILLRRVYLA
jgi:hypothetical protein